MTKETNKYEQKKRGNIYKVTKKKSGKAVSHASIWAIRHATSKIFMFRAEGSKKCPN